jgi:hypothetical protein
VIGGQNGNGLGWLLTLVDSLCSAYGWTLAEVWRTPLATALVLLTARRLANGAEWAEPDYYEREQMGDIAASLGIELNG